DLRPARADAEAVEVAAARGGNVPVLPILIRESKIIHHSGVDDAGHAQEILVDPILVRHVVRGERGNGGGERPAVSVSVMRVAHEERVLVVVTVIDSPAKLFAC